jgi:hypothetical protein
MESIQEKNLKILIASTEKHIEELMKFDRDSHFYQVRLEQCNTYICDDTRSTIAMLTAKLRNYELTLTKYQ